MYRKTAILASPWVSSRYRSKSSHSSVEKPDGERLAEQEVWPHTAAELPFGEFLDHVGTLDLLLGAGAERFPSFCRSYGVVVLALLSGLSRLVGMVCPGRRGLFSGFDLRLDRAVQWRGL